MSKYANVNFTLVVQMVLDGAYALPSGLQTNPRFSHHTRA